MKTKFTLVCILFFSYAAHLRAQSTSANNFGTPAKYLGYFNAVNLNFHTFGINRMRLQSATGFLGIGPNSIPLTPFRLTVDDNIDIITANPFDGYRILSQRFLTMPGGLLGNNTFVGISGSLTGPFGVDNTMIGFSCGGGMGTACSNSPHHSTCMGSFAGYKLGGGFITCIGYKAGYNVGDGDFCTFVGSNAGENSTCTGDNAFFGGNAGNQNISGNGNTFIGTSSALISKGDNNVALGMFSAVGLTTGSRVIAIGPNTGSGLGSNSNIILVGNNSDVTGTIANSAAFGDNTMIEGSNQMILGNNNMNVGIGLSGDIVRLGPHNKLEIDAGIAGFSPTPVGNVGASGLRLRDLHSQTLTVPNPGAGVLAVDTNGDVIYVKGGCCLGNACIVAGSNPLASSWQIPLNNNNFYFDDIATNIGSVHIGTSSPCGVINARLDVINASKPAAGLFLTQFNSSGGTVGVTGRSQNSGTGSSIGVSGISLPSSGNSTGVSGVSNGTSSTSGFATGVSALSTTNSAMNLGVTSYAINGSIYSISGNFDAFASSSPLNFGIESDVHSNTFVGGTNYGSYFNVNGNAASSFNYAVFADCGPSSGNTPPTGPNYAGYFNGDVLVTGTFAALSDSRIKKEVKEIDNALDMIEKLNPKTYFFDQSVYPQIHLSGNKQYGFIAQDLENVLPELIVNVHHPVAIDSLGKEVSKAVDLKGVNYTGMIALMMEGIKEQQKMIEDQQKQIDDLKNMAENFAPSPNENINLSNITLSDNDVIILNQNVPNPFAEQTLISYNLPENSGKAQLLFYNSDGKLINSLDISQKGKGQITVFANDLSSGVYSYTLVVDGKIFDTKKMIKGK